MIDRPRYFRVTRACGGRRRVSAVELVGYIEVEAENTRDAMRLARDLAKETFGDEEAVGFLFLHPVDDPEDDEASWALRPSIG